MLVLCAALLWTTVANVLPALKAFGDYIRENTLLQLVFGTSIMGACNAAFNGALTVLPDTWRARFVCDVTIADGALVKRIHAFMARSDCREAIGYKLQTKPCIVESTHQRMRRISEGVDSQARVGEDKARTHGHVLVPYIKREGFVSVENKRFFVQPAAEGALIISSFQGPEALSWFIDKVMAKTVADDDLDVTGPGRCIIRLNIKGEWEKPFAYMHPQPIDSMLLEQSHLRIVQDARTYFQQCAERGSSAKFGRRGACIWGNPDSGKTTLVFALATELDLPIVVPDLTAEHINNDVLARSFQALTFPAIVFFDDADALSCFWSRSTADVSPLQRDRSGCKVTLNGMLTLMDGCSSVNSAPKYFVIATNAAGRIDAAIMSRCSLDICMGADRWSQDAYVRYLQQHYPDTDVHEIQDAAAVFATANLKPRVFCNMVLSQPHFQSLMSPEYLMQGDIDITRPITNCSFFASWSKGTDEFHNHDVYIGFSQFCSSLWTFIVGSKARDPQYASAMQALEAAAQCLQDKFGVKCRARIELFMRNQLCPATALANLEVLETFRQKPIHRDSHVMLYISRDWPKPRLGSIYDDKCDDFATVSVRLTDRSTFINAIVRNLDAAVDVGALYERCKEISTPMGIIPISVQRMNVMIDAASCWEEVVDAVVADLFGSSETSFDMIRTGDGVTLAPSEVPGRSQLIVKDMRRPMKAFLKRPLPGEHLTLEFNE